MFDKMFDKFVFFPPIENTLILLKYSYFPLASRPVSTKMFYIYVLHVFPA